MSKNIYRYIRYVDIHIHTYVCIKFVFMQVYIYLSIYLSIYVG